MSILGPDGASRDRGVPCGGEAPFTLATGKGEHVDLTVQIPDPGSIARLLMTAGVPEEISRALVSGLRDNSATIVKLPTDIEAILDGKASTQAEQIGLVMIAASQNGAAPQPGAARNHQIIGLGNNIIRCFREDQARAYPPGGAMCGDSIDDYKSPEQVRLHDTLVQRLTELGRSLHLTEEVAKVVAHGFANKREELVEFANSSGENISLIGSVLLAKINAQHTRPLRVEELFLRGSETGCLVVNLLANPNMIGWESRAGGLIDEMHTFYP